MRFTLDTKKRGETRTIALRNMATHYSAESGVETVVADKPSALGIALRGETVEVRYDSQCSEKARLSMFSATGQMIVAHDVALQAGTNTLDIDAKSAGTGIYFVVRDTIRCVCMYSKRLRHNPMCRSLLSLSYGCCYRFLYISS